MTTIAAVGDVRVYRDDPDSIFQYVGDTLKKPDITFCQSESSYSDKGSQGSSGPRGAAPRDLRGYPAFAAAGFDVVSMASNHTMDWGRDALIDSMERMHRDGIQTIGAGSDIEEARRPAILEHDGVKVAFLGYCSVAPKGYYAVAGRAGVAPMRAITHYEPFEEDQPGTPCKTMTWPLQRDLDALIDDIHRVRDQVDLVVLSFHWGVHHIPVLIADYQPVVARAAIDAGADLVLGHHPHILKAIEVYKGKAIFYSLGNFALDTNEDRRPDIPWRQEMKDVYRLYGTPGPGDYRKSVEANYSIIVNVDISEGTIGRISYQPVQIDENRNPIPVSASDELGQPIVRYVEAITHEAGFETDFQVDREKVVIAV